MQFPWSSPIRYMLPSSQTIITVRNSSCGKAMFLQVSVILSTVGGVCLWVQGGTPPGQTCPRQIPHKAGTPLVRYPLDRHLPWADTPQADTIWADTPLSRHPLADIPQPDTPLPDGHYNRQYASYWNAFLFLVSVYLYL